MKRQLKALAERLLDARIVRPHDIALLFEQEHLGRIFRRFHVDCVFDVGANKGQYADMIRSRAGYAGPIISFEPVPEAAQLLREKASRDALWFVEQVALDASPGTRDFRVMSDSEFSSFHVASKGGVAMFDRKMQTTRVISVQTSTLQAEHAKYSSKFHFERPFLKIDAQGHDVAIASGAGEGLSRFVGLQSELSIRHIYDETPSFIEALGFYQERGFVLSALVPNNAGHFPYLVEIDCIMLNARALPQDPFSFKGQPGAKPKIAAVPAH